MSDLWGCFYVVFLFPIWLVQGILDGNIRRRPPVDTTPTIDPGYRGATSRPEDRKAPEDFDTWLDSFGPEPDDGIAPFMWWDR